MLLLFKLLSGMFLTVVTLKYAAEKRAMLILVVGILSVFILSIPANAATTGSLTLSGSVAVNQSIVITPNGSNNVNLNILTGETDRNVASVAETSNNAIGYKIEVSSAGNGYLVNTGDSSKKTPYQLGYNGGTKVTLTTITQVLKNVSSLSGLTTNNSAVLLDVTAYPGAPAGTYLDTVTLSIVAN